MSSDDLAYIYRKIFAAYFYPCSRHPFYCSLGFSQKKICMSTADPDSLPYYGSQEELKYFEEQNAKRISEGFHFRWKQARIQLLGYTSQNTRREDLANYRISPYMTLYIAYSCHSYHFENTFYDNFRITLLRVNDEAILTSKVPLINERWGLEIFKNQVKTYSEVHHYVYYFSGVPIKFVYLSSNRFSPSHYLKKEVIGNKVMVYCLHYLHKMGWTLITIHITVINY